jgi:hypothetical protein
MLLAARIVRESLGLFCLLIAVEPSHADGCVFARRGTYVPEKEQYAYIEWEAGVERLFVATRTEASQGPALWVVNPLENISWFLRIIRHDATGYEPRLRA